MSKNAGTSSQRRPKSSSADGSGGATSPARALAAEVLARVWQDGAYAAATLDAELGRAVTMADNDKRLATELVYGVLRTARFLEAQIARHATSSRWQNKAPVRAHMLIGAYSLLFLDRVPAHAAVAEAVGAIRAAADAKVAGFANAVLRKIAAERGATTLEAAERAALPPWLRHALGERLGSTREPPPLCLCLRAGEERARWLEALRAASPGRFEPGRHSPRAIVAHGAGDQRALPGSGSAWIVQEEGAQLCALALGARAGETVLDACAGRGNKSLLLAEAVAPGGAVDAADLHADKLARLRAGPAGRLVRETFGVDWTRGSGAVAGPYDRVLVDAPCSGSGTLRRRPEIAARLSAADVARLAGLQLTIARAAAQHLRPGGRLVYSVCSLLPGEGQEVARELAQGGLAPAPFDADLDLFQGKSELLLTPAEHGTDGYFIASFTKGS